MRARLFRQLLRTLCLLAAVAAFDTNKILLFENLVIKFVNTAFGALQAIERRNVTEFTERHELEPAQVRFNDVLACSGRIGAFVRSN